MGNNWRRHSFTWGKRVVLVILILTALCYGVLTLAARSKEPLRKGLEDYLAQASGQNAEITELSETRLVPDVIFNMKGINIRDGKDSKKVYLHADTVYVALPFWRLLLGLDGYAALEVKGVEVASGFFLPKKLNVDFGGISDPSPGTAPANFVIEGDYNARPLLLTLEMNRKMTKKGPLYLFQGTSPVTFKLGALEGNAILTRSMTDVMLDEAHIVRGGHDVKFIAKNLDRKPLNVKMRGQIDGAPFNALLTKKGDSTLLTITPETAVREDLLKIGAFVKEASEDLGVAGPDDALVIEIAAPETMSAPAAEKSTKESQ